MTLLSKVQKYHAHNSGAACAQAGEKVLNRTAKWRASFQYLLKTHPDNQAF